ncbi:MAG: hypothetical protein ACXWQO_01035 [Bdellovibrionota bacterium]
MKRLALSLALLLFPLAAFALLPPAFFLYSEVASHRGKGTIPGISFTVSRPLPAGGEEVIGGLTLPGLVAGNGAWPTLSLLFQSDDAALAESIRGFGIPILKETDLLRVSREQAAAMKDPPRPFYKSDPSVTMKRFRKTYAWVHSDKDGARSVWIEKDTFLPLHVEAPCPSVELPWTKAGENRCAVEFRNVYPLRRGNANGGRIIFLKDGVPALYFSFDRLSKESTGAPVVSSDAKYPAEIKALSDILFH